MLNFWISLDGHDHLKRSFKILYLTRGDAGFGLGLKTQPDQHVHWGWLDDYGIVVSGDEKNEEGLKWDKYKVKITSRTLPPPNFKNGHIFSVNEKNLLGATYSETLAAFRDLGDLVRLRVFATWKMIPAKKSTVNQTANTDTGLPGFCCFQ